MPNPVHRAKQRQVSKQHKHRQRQLSLPRVLRPLSRMQHGKEAARKHARDPVPLSRDQHQRQNQHTQERELIPSPAQIRPAEHPHRQRLGQVRARHVVVADVPIRLQAVPHQEHNIVHHRRVHRQPPTPGNNGEVHRRHGKDEDRQQTQPVDHWIRSTARTRVGERSIWNRGRRPAFGNVQPTSKHRSQTICYG